MATDHYRQVGVPRNDSNEQNGATMDKWKSAPATFDGSDNNPSGGLDCNICLDSVQDPVVTLCGHLYCWPCIYKWIQFQSVAAEKSDQQQPQCPVCKAEVSDKTLVPLYGRGQTTKPSKGKALHLGIVVPRRPPSPGCGVHTSPRPGQQLHHQSNPQRSQPYQSHHLGGTTMTPMTDAFQPMAGLFGETVYARIFGNFETTLQTHPNSYYLSGSSSPRVRRHIMRSDESLSRVCFFLFCCVILCLLLF